VSVFAVRYFAADGEELPGLSPGASDWPSRVARMEVTVRALRDGRSVMRVLSTCLGPT